MIRQPYNLSFLVPRFLTTPLYSLHISDHAITYGEFGLSGSDFYLKHYGQVKIPQGLIAFGEVQDEDKLVALLKRVARKEGMKLVRVAAPDKEAYTSVFYRTGLEAILVEAHEDALARAIIPHRDTSVTMIVDFNRLTTHIAIAQAGRVLFSQTNYREEVSEGDDAIFELTQDIDRCLISWGKENTEPVSKILLAGHEAKNVELAQYLARTLKTKVEHANVWVNICDTKVVTPDISFSESLSYGTMLGLGLGVYL